MVIGMYAPNTNHDHIRCVIGSLKGLLLKGGGIKMFVAGSSYPLRSSLDLYLTANCSVGFVRYTPEVFQQGVTYLDSKPCLLVCLSRKLPISTCLFSAIHKPGFSSFQLSLCPVSEFEYLRCLVLIRP